jgi:thiamine transport system substrate-binding protein
MRRHRPRTAASSERRPRPLVRLAAASLVGVVLLAACGEEAEPVTLTLLTHDSFDVSTEVLEGFTADTGIEVVVAPVGDAGTTVNQAILTRDAPQGDVLFGVDTTFLSRALDAELFVPYESPELAAVPERFQLDPEHRVTPIDHGDVCLNHDVAWFDERDLAVPTDLAELTDPAYAGLLAVQNPATSSPGLAFLLATVERFGEDGYLAFWEGLRDNDVVITDGWSQAYYEEFSATGEGDRPLVVSYASSPPAEVYFADPQPDEAPTGVIEASCFRQVEFAGILAGTPHEPEARQLIDFLLSPPFQEDVPLTMFVFPVREDAELPEVFVQHAVVPDEPFELDPEVIGERREAWIEAWTATMLR